jgi:hypothetical protein
MEARRADALIDVDCAVSSIVARSCNSCTLATILAQCAVDTVATCEARGAQADVLVRTHLWTTERMLYRRNGHAVGVTVDTLCAILAGATGAFIDIHVAVAAFRATNFALVRKLRDHVIVADAVCVPADTLTIVSVIRGALARVAAVCALSNVARSISWCAITVTNRAERDIR